MKTSSSRTTRKELLLAQQTKKLINRQRRLHGMRALKDDRELRQAAHSRADDMARFHYMEHCQHNGDSWDDIVDNYEKSLGHLGENIAHGFDDAASLVRAWMNSPLHRKNILDRRFRFGGLVWRFTNNGDSYVAHEFGG